MKKCGSFLKYVVLVCKIVATTSSASKSLPLQCLQRAIGRVFVSNNLTNLGTKLLPTESCRVHNIDLFFRGGDIPLTTPMSRDQ